MEFRCIQSKVEAQVIQKKSKFIANFFPVETLEEAEEWIKSIKKRYFDARHNCFAYRIVKQNQFIEKSSDDGEPSGTAGVPMLTILQKNDLANVLIVVTRYFGGTLLGTGGLVRAYSDSLLKTIEKSQIILKCNGVQMLVTIEYSQFDMFQHYCKNNNILIRNVEYSEFITCKIELEEHKKEKLLKDFKAKSVILKQIEEISKKYITKCI